MTRRPPPDAPSHACLPTPHSLFDNLLLLKAGQVVYLGPAERADLTQGDIIVAVKGEEVNTLADFYRAIWALGPAGVGVPLTLAREGDVFEVEVRSKDRRAFLKRPKMH